MIHMGLGLIIALALNVLAGIAVATVWTKYVGTPTVKGQKLEPRWKRREDIEIDPANVPLFRPTCRRTR